MTHRSVALLLLATLVAQGCGGGESTGPPRYEVTGVLKKGAEPLAGVSLRLVDQTGASVAEGVAGDDGAFSLLAEPGSYKLVLEAAPTPPEVGGKMTAEAPFAESWSSAETSPKSVTVEETTAELGDVDVSAG